MRALSLERGRPERATEPFRHLVDLISLMDTLGYLRLEERLICETAKHEQLCNSLEGYIIIPTYSITTDGYGNAAVPRPHDSVCGDLMARAQLQPCEGGARAELLDRHARDPQAGELHLLE